MDVNKLIFNMYKDEVIEVPKFRNKIKKYDLTSRQVTDIIAKINNYQIKKYGQRLNNKFEILSAEECRRISKLRKVEKNNKIKKIYITAYKNKKLNW